MSISQAFSAAFTPFDRGEIYEWLRDNITLGTSYAKQGPFRIENSEYLRRAYELLRSDSTRVVNLLKGTQTGGTLVADTWLPYLMANSPGPVMWAGQSNDDCSDHFITRPQGLIENCKALQDLWERRHKKINLYLLPHMSIYVGGSGEAFLQRKSIKYLITDECWNWKPGMMKEAFARVTAFGDSYKILNISQAGTNGDDWTEQTNEAKWYYWHYTCAKCNHMQPFEFFGAMLDDP